MLGSIQVSKLIQVATLGRGAGAEVGCVSAQKLLAEDIQCAHDPVEPVPVDSGERRP